MPDTDPCPCGRGRAYADCCRPLHRGERKAATAEELMRSRYAAFARGQADYLVKTLHPSKRAPHERRDLERSLKHQRWTRLEVLATEGGSMFELSGTVTFAAHYDARGQAGVLRERSRFVREDGVWYYVDGDASSSAG